jgi:pimeloyl-ACP methyl ester carboxylesterase
MTVPEAIVLTFPGGAEHSRARATRFQTSYLRMSAFARSLHLWGRRNGLAVWELCYRYRGWNGEDMSPLDDGLVALEEVRRSHGTLPVVLVGHSMGGRVALRLAGDPSVRGVVGLAPWLPDGEPTRQLAGRHLVLAHGSRDRVLRPASTIRYAERARLEHPDNRIEVIIVDGAGHALIRRPLTWDRIVRHSVRAIAGI